MKEPEKLASEETDSEPLTEAQRDLVRRRLADYQDNPDEPVATLSDIKRELCL